MALTTSELRAHSPAQSAPLRACALRERLPVECMACQLRHAPSERPAGRSSLP
jgi:hypothetical protein